MELRGILKMKNDPFKDDIIVRYLLGDLPEGEQCEIEDRAFQDPQTLQQILSIENDLIDEYVRGELSDSSRRKFEGRFLASPERQKKVAFAKALTTVLPETAVIEKSNRPLVATQPPGLWNLLKTYLRGLNPAASFSLAAAALLFIAGSLWLVTDSIRLRGKVAQLQAEQQTQQRQQQTLEGELANERTRNDDLASRLQSEEQQRERNETLLRELEQQREEKEAAVKPTLSSILSFALLPGTRGGSSRPKLTLPTEARLVRLQLGLEAGDEYKSYRVQLNSQTTPAVWSQSNLSARAARGGQVVVLNLPAKLLTTGQYELALTGITNDGRTEAVAYYNFDVQKR
jgi:TolA-binding protein